MDDLISYPGLEAPLEKVEEWLSFVDDVFEAHDPAVDVRVIFEDLVQLATSHRESHVRCESLRVLSQGFEKHSQSACSMASIAGKLGGWHGLELLLGINVIGSSCEIALREFLTPFLQHSDKAVRAECVEAMQTLELADGERTG